MPSEPPIAGFPPDNVARSDRPLRPVAGAALRPVAGAAAFRPSLERLDWVSALPSAAAPGFVFLAGACGGVPVCGGGRSRGEAVARLAGEAAEVLAMQAAPAPTDAPGDPRIDAVWTDLADPPRIAARALISGRAIGLPAAAAHLGPAGRRADAPRASLGLAAGPDRAGARLAALLELIERDAAAAWWLDGGAPRLLDARVTAAAARDLARMRAGEPALGRSTGFLDLASPTGVPVVCAMSRDADGRGLAIGLKAALDPAAAAAGAVIELLQMELALELARHRATRGAAVAGDAGPLARAALNPDAFAAFAGRAPIARARPEIAGLDGLSAHLAALGHEIVIADLAGRPGGLAVVKAVAPGLRPMPGAQRAQAEAPGAQAALM